MEDITVTAIERDARGAVRAVNTTDGRLEAEAVVNAAGPWAAEVGHLLGIDIPIARHRRQAFGISSMPWLGADLPLTVDLASGAYVHPRPDGSVIGGNDCNVRAGFDEEVDWCFSLRSGRPGSLAGSLVWLRPRSSEDRGGLRDMTPDEHAIVGPRRSGSGGLDRRGLLRSRVEMRSPVVGELLSEWLIDGAPTLEPLRTPSRAFRRRNERIRNRDDRVLIERGPHRAPCQALPSGTQLVGRSRSRHGAQMAT